MSLLGPATAQSISTNVCTSHVRATDILFEMQVECLWKSDEVPCVTNSMKTMSKEDRYTLDLMNTSERFVDGRYQLRLPWKPGGPQLPDNHQQAVTRLSYLKRRLEKDPVLKDKYSAFIMEYLSIGYACKLYENENQTNVKWYLCHPPVFHPQKPNKVRVVLDCAARFRGESLNDELLQGPDIVNSFVVVLMQFRKVRMAIVSDFEAMFHQVRVDPKDNNVLHFVW